MSMTGFESAPGWPVRLQGVTESVVTTLGPNDRWNRAALGLHANAANGSDVGTDDDTGDERTNAEPESDEDDASASDAATVTARTWGRTRTWRNFRERGEGYVQFVHDPVVFTRAALTVNEGEKPILDAAAAWVRVAVEAIDAGESGGTQWVDWELRPQETAIVDQRVPTIDRGHAAVIEATVAASRLDIESYDTEKLCDRLAYFEAVVERCGGEREHEALSVLVEQIGRRW